MMPSMVEVEVQCGQPVVIEKLFGPTVFGTLRITANYDRYEWVIERENDDGVFEEWCAIPAVDSLAD